MTEEVINELKKYILGKKNTEKVEISVLKLNRIIKALEQESILDKIKTEILDEAEYAYADFDKYKEDILHTEPDELPEVTNEAFRRYYKN